MKNKQTAKYEADLREEFQAAYKQKIKDMYGMFELKYQSLHDSILSVFDRIKKDEILSTMFNDRTSSIHLQDRVKQIFSEVVAEQRELIFKKMGTQITNLKFENEQLSRQLKKIKESADHLEKDFYTQRLGFQQTKNNVNQQLRKTRQQNYNMQIDFKNKERQVQNLKHKMEELTQQNYELKQLLNSMKENKDDMAFQNQQLNFYKSQIKGLQNQVQELKTLLAENQQNFDRKYQSKKREFKQKIQEYKAVINQMRMDRNKTQSTLKHNQQEQAQNNFQKKLSLIVRDHEKKLSQMRSSKEKQKAQIQRKYEYKIKEMQGYFEKMLHNKINEIEQNTTNYFEKMREEGANMEKQLMIYQENYVPLPEFEDQIAKREQVIMMMKKKLEEFQTNNSCLSKNQQILLNKLRDAESLLTENKHKIYQLEEFNQQITNKIKSYEQSNNIMKINDRKVKEQFEQYQRIVKKTKQENDDLKKNIIQLEENKNNLENVIREKERKIKDDAQELQLKTKKIKKDAQFIENLIKQKDSSLTASNQIKKEMANLEYKLKDQEMTTNLLKNSWQAKVTNAQLQLKDKTAMMKQLQTKYQQMCQIYQEQKKKNYQIQNLLKKYQMQSKFYKQSGEMHKNELSSSIQQLRKMINERNDKIQKLQIQIENKDKRIRAIQSDHMSNKQKTYAQNKYLKSKIQQLTKILTTKLQGLRKQCRSITQCIGSRQIIMRNDQAVMMSTFYKQLIHLQLHNQKEKDNRAKKLKQQLSYVQSNEIKLIKSEFQDKIKAISEKNEYQKTLLKQQIKQKQDKIEQMNKQIKKYQIQIKKQKQQSKNTQRQYQILTMKFQKEKEHYQQRYQQLSKQMKEQKEFIIKQYNDKKCEMQHQITGLLNSIKRFKTEIELIQAKHQEEKLVVASQLKTIKQQEEAVSRITSQKDNEILKYQRQYQNLLQIKRNLQNQTRGYAQTLNKKIQLIHQLQLKENQITGEFNLARTKLDRVLEENSQLKRKIAQKEEQVEQNLKMRMRMQSQLKDIKGALNRSTKNNQLRALNELSMQTLQLSQKVNEMRKVNNFLQSKTPLRS